MKQGWKIKKLGEVCEVYQPKTISGDMLVKNGDYLVYGANGIIGRYNEYNHTDSEILLTCRGATCGSINVSRPYSWINGNAMVIKPLDASIIKSFLKLYLKSVNWSNVITGAAQPQITRQSLAPLPIPIPPLPEQERIVEELDLLSGVIEKKRRQLKELDNLAHSIFYDMFGDPITNEKGWEIKPMNEVAEIVGGSTPKTNIEEYWGGDNYWVTPAELHGARYICRTERCITDNAVDKTHLSLLPIGTVLLSSRAPIGKVCITRVPMYCNQGFKNIVCSNKLHSEYVYQYLLDKTYYLNSLGTGATFKEISKRVVEQISIPVPPLTLQQQFAEKVEAIEKQKALLKQSIEEAETLFNSRMDYYFN